MADENRRGEGPGDEVASIWRKICWDICLQTSFIYSEKRAVFRERSSRTTVSFTEQIMSKDKYPIIISPQMEAIVFIILQIFFAMHAVLKIGEY